jgi:uncharacterized membrane protein YdfJ with MMPL/SSD domain
VVETETLQRVSGVLARVAMEQIMRSVGITSTKEIYAALTKTGQNDIDARISKIDIARENLLEALTAIDEMKTSAHANKRELEDLRALVERVGKERDDLVADRELIAKLTAADKDRLRRLLGAPTRLQSVGMGIVTFVFGALVTWGLTYAYDFGIKEWMHNVFASWLS